MSARKPWTEKEDRICCQTVLNEYIIKKSNTDINNLVNAMAKNSVFNGRSEGTIKMRLQNIKYFLDKRGIQNIIPLTSLSNCAEQTEEIMTEELLKVGIEVLK